MAVAEPIQFSMSFTPVLGRVVMSVHGDLDLYSARRMRDALTDLVDRQGNLDVVIDLKDLAFVDSTGLDVLVGALHRARAIGGHLTLSAPSRAVLQVLEVAGLHRLFDISST
jgi:anti-anti-sigma factor